MSHHAASETGEQPRIERSTILPGSVFSTEGDPLVPDDDDAPTVQDQCPQFDEDGNLTFSIDAAAAHQRREEIIPPPPPREIARWLRACAAVTGSR